jgi:hypothetical protein
MALAAAGGCVIPNLAMAAIEREVDKHIFTLRSIEDLPKP